MAHAGPEHPGEEQDGSAEGPDALLTRRGRARARAAAVRERADRISARAQRERTARPAVDAAFEMVDRDAEVGGGIMAGALAYRMFIWLLPVSLVAIAGLGIAADAAATSPQNAASSMGLAGLASGSVAASAKSSARWYALGVGIPVTLYATRSILRTLIVVHRLVWADLRHAVPKPTAAATLRLTAALLCFLVISGLTATARHASLLAGTLALVCVPALYTVLWLGVSWHLPHRDASWHALVPGALVFGLGAEVVHAITTFFIAPAAASKQGTYGSLGIAASLLLGLFFVSRLVVATAVVNATLWDRRQRTRQG